MDIENYQTPKYETRIELLGLKLLILDVDDTLVRPCKPGFYEQYSTAVNKAVAVFLKTDLETGTKIANYYRKHFGGGEQALFSGTIGSYFPEYSIRAPDFKTLYDMIVKIDPQGFFEPHEETIELINKIRKQEIFVAAVTSTPELLSRKILAECGFNPEKDFDLYKAYTSELGPPKMTQKSNIFVDIAKYFQVSPQEAFSIGDSYRYDIQPAQEIGMKTCLIGIQRPSKYDGLFAQNILEVFKAEN